jgi:hypothetical protein
VLRRVPGAFAVARLTPAEGVPPWFRLDKPLASVTVTAEEISVVTLGAVVPTGVRAERDFAAYVLEGPLAFDAVGVLASLSRALAEEGISVLAISTFDTDYFLVRERDRGRAEAAWHAHGHRVDPG